MRYRKLDANGDYTLGTGSDFLIDSPEAVAQAVDTRLKLWAGEWFVDTADGTPWLTDVLGKRYAGRNVDSAIQSRILSTQGVNSILTYTGTYDGNTRKYSVVVEMDTIYGVVTYTGTL